MRLQFGPAATLASDPLVGFVTRFSARLAVLAQGRGAVLVGGAGLLVAIATAVSWDGQRGMYQAPGPAATLTDLRDVEQLAALFNEQQGVPRLILLLAPT